MNVRWSALPIVVLIAGCASRNPSQPPYEPSPWQPPRASTDVNDAIARRDYRLLSMNGIFSYTPGIDGLRPWPTGNGRRVQAIDLGGSDLVPPKQVAPLRAMEDYAERYNGLMADYLAAHPKPPMPAATHASSD